MNTPIRTALLIFMILCATSTGCAPIVVALPPPLPLPSSLLSPDKGETAVNAGVRAWVAIDPEDLTVISPSESPMGSQIEYGVTDKLQVGITPTVSLLAGLYPGVTAGYTVLNNDKSKVGLSVALNAAAIDGYYYDAEVLVDENGEPVLDENGNQTYTDVEHAYGYFSVARGLGVRGERALHPKVDLVYAANIAYSSTIARYGLDANDMDQATWANASLGVVVTPVKSLHLGTTLQCLGSIPDSSLPLVGMGFSLGYTFPAP